MNFNWCTTAIGSCTHLARPLSGAPPRPAWRWWPPLALVSLQRLLAGPQNPAASLFGDNWHEAALRRPRRGQYATWGEAMLAPSLIYSPGVAALLDAGLPLHGTAHITGGGVADNFQRVLKNGLGAVLDNLFEPLPAMQRLCEIGGSAPKPPTSTGTWAPACCS